jgi:hypothetical protein
MHSRTKTKFLADPDFNPWYSQLRDFTRVAKIDLNADDICKLAERDIFHPTSSRAILVSNDLAQGLAQLFTMLCKHSGENRVRIFRNLDEALEWVFMRNTRSDRYAEISPSTPAYLTD